MSFDLRREFLLLRSLNALNHPSAARGEGVVSLENSFDLYLTTTVPRLLQLLLHYD